MSKKTDKKYRFSFGMFLITIGIVYGDIGTSPLYVMKSIMEGNGGITNVDSDFIIGSLSLVIWTVTLLTTVKYVLIAMKADNHGEGGIFSLYTLVKKYAKWLIIPAMVGGAALLADGVLTPAVTVTTAVEGLRSIPVMDKLLGKGQTLVVIITIVIISALFIAQKAGTSKIGNAFGPVMLIWFSFLGIVGTVNVFSAPEVFLAFNPIRAIRLLASPYNLKGFMILGSIFLAATGAEALYSDMGHVGRENIYMSWPFVNACLFLNYLGQGAWMITNSSNPAFADIEGLNPFYMMLPENMRAIAIALSAAAAIIASQALITGSFTLVSEAIRLDLMPHLRVLYPSDTKGQIYIGAVNNLMWIMCVGVVLYFRSSARIEAAYGLAITVTMLMTTLLLTVYLAKVKKRKLVSAFVLVVFGAIEAVFFISSLSKFMIGGYITVIIALLIFIVMLIWHRGTEIENKNRVSLPLKDYIKQIGTLRNDKNIPMMCDNIVYLENEDSNETMDRDIIYSLLDKGPKRANAYWFFSVNVLDDPYTMTYDLDTYGTDYFFRVRLNLGFKVGQRINVYIRQVVADMLKRNEMPSQNKSYSIYGKSDVGNFKFVTIKKAVPSVESEELNGLDLAVLKAKYAIRRLAGSKLMWYGLDTSNNISEMVPLVISQSNKQEKTIERAK